jgi:hypothetical protein
MSTIYDWPTWALVVVLFSVMLLVNEVGFRFGRAQFSLESERSHSVSNVLKASVLGLVALLLGFSFSLTTSRFGQRQRVVLDEANAIGTCYLRAELLAEPARKAIQSSLKEYTDARLDYFNRALIPGELERTTQAMDVALEALWAGVSSAVAADREQARVSQIVPAANAVIDLNATRAWAIQNQLPSPVFLLLAACAVVSSGLMGHSSGQAGKRHLGVWAALNCLVILVLFVVLDFDRPRRGFIQINHAPLIELRESMMRPFGSE